MQFKRALEILLEAGKNDTWPEMDKDPVVNYLVDQIVSIPDWEDASEEDKKTYREEVEKWFKEKKD